MSQLVLDVEDETGEGEEITFDVGDATASDVSDTSFQLSLEANAFQHFDEIKHFLHRPDMFIGTNTREVRNCYCYDIPGNKITLKKVTLAEALQQIFLELLGNTADNAWRSRERGIDPVRIEVSVDTEWASVKNYGMVIPVATSTSGRPVPEMIFGVFRTSSNYNDTQKRYYIGKNGYGAKATNVCSLKFMIECADPERGLLYKQTWENHMTVCYPPVIEPYEGPGYTLISFSPDFAYFGATCFEDETLEIYAAHCAEISFTCQIPVVFNGTTIEVNGIVDYAKLFFTITKKSAITYRDPDGVYELCVVDTPGQAVCLSFVNGIITSRGGVHVDAAYKAVMKTIKETLGKLLEGIRITKRDIGPHVSLFLNCRLDKPGFSSQTKDYLKKPTIKVNLPPNLMAGIKNWNLIEEMHREIERKQKNLLKKTDGKRGQRPEIKGLQDAGFALKGQPEQATLIAIEGKSASQYPLVFIGYVPNNMGRQHFGILPLHGVPLNVLNASFFQTASNRDWKAVRSALGLDRLEPDVDLSIDKNFSKLRYHTFLMMPDADNDGKHILGLVLLYFMKFYPQLVQRGFIKFLRTPVVRVKYHGSRYLFYTMSSYRRWISELPDGTRIPKDNILYFKGLGSSEDNDILDDFNSPKIVTFQIDEKAVESLILVFDKTHANKRKQWLADLFDITPVDVEVYTELPISVFINHEFIDFSLEDVARSVPGGYDGLKDAQRKALMGGFDKLKGASLEYKINVFQLANRAAEISRYTHGVLSLGKAIVKMSAGYIGSNNLPYFIGRGQFGSRVLGGKDAADPRYIGVSQSPYFKKIFRAEDVRLEKPIIEDGDPREPEDYFPILPMHVINGVTGVGTGWSTDIPNHNPLDVVLWLEQRLLRDLQPEQDYQLPTLRPWYRGFTGTVQLTQKGFNIEGCFEVRPNGNIWVTELPVGVWTEDYENKLIEWEKNKIITGFDNRCTDKKIWFIIYKYLADEPTLKNLGLVKKGSYRNMTVLFRTPERRILPKTYNDITTLLEEWYILRLAKYYERKELQLAEIDEEIKDIRERARFVHAVRSGELVIANRDQADAYADMDRMNFNHKWYNKVRTFEYGNEGYQQILDKMEAKLAERRALDELYPEQIWYSELEEFASKYCKLEKLERSTLESCHSDIMLEIKTEKPKREKKDSPGFEIIESDEEQEEEDIEMEVVEDE